MRRLIVIALLGLAFWQAALDWQSTIGEGYAFRLTSIGAAMAGIWPDLTASLVDALKQAPVTWIWDPAGKTLLAFPVTLALALLAGLLWLTRRRRARGRG